MKINLFSFRCSPPSRPAIDEDRILSPLKIIHAGGFVEQYYMAIPASEIMTKYPKSVLARPEVFHKPWDSLVNPDEILSVGERLYLMPVNTLLKLRRRIRRNNSTNENINRSKTMFVNHRSGKQRVRVIEIWQPSLMVIDEVS